ncbi:DUF1508 domain-containing protein [Acidovorax sp. Root219]|uniref:YegP family protein n=1 Tax=Acidovorax sp. Root219 TaxID=1736493 RepID=UPI0009EC32FA|nr:DUF1508 domain-containing protein [Acidovorax sp. Root219]
MQFEIYQVPNKNAVGLLAMVSGEWRWRLKSANHEIIASGEGYKNKADALHCIDLIKSTTAKTPVNEVVA